MRPRGSWSNQVEREYFAYALAVSVLLSATVSDHAQAGPLNLLKRAAAKAGMGKDETTSKAAPETPAGKKSEPEKKKSEATASTAPEPAHAASAAAAPGSTAVSGSNSGSAPDPTPESTSFSKTSTSPPAPASTSASAPGSTAAPASTSSTAPSSPSAPSVPAKAPAANPANKPPGKAQPAPQASHPGPVRDKWAVLIGVNKFQDSSLPPIRFAPNNVSSLALLLQDATVGKFAADHVTQLANPTKAQIQQTLSDQWLLKKALPNDMIVLYINSRAWVDPANGEVYIYAADTAAKDATGGGIPLKQTLAEVKQRSQSRHIITLLDLSPTQPGVASSDSGKAPEAKEAATSIEKPGEPPLYEKIASETTTSILAASKLTEPSNENSMNKTSYFVQYLIDGLRAGAGMLPFGAIAQHVFESVPADVHSTLKLAQSPQLAIPVVNKHIIEIALGMPTKSSIPAKKIAIGHPVDQLPHQRPDLVRGSRPAIKIAPSKPEPEPQDDGTDVMGDVDFGPYMTKMKKDIQAKWKPPKGFEDRRVVAVFTIMRDGKIVDPSIVDGSGLKDVDDSAMSALQAASPLDPLPTGSPRYVQMRYQFDWRVKRD